MNYNFETTRDFEKELKALAKKYASIKSAMEKLQADIELNPNQGSNLGGGFKKNTLFHNFKRQGQKWRMPCCYL